MKVGEEIFRAGIILATGILMLSTLGILHINPNVPTNIIMSSVNIELIAVIVGGLAALFKILFR